MFFLIIIYTILLLGVTSSKIILDLRIPSFEVTTWCDQRKKWRFATYPQMATVFFKPGTTKGSSRPFPWLEVQKHKKQKKRSKYGTYGTIIELGTTFFGKTTLKLIWRVNFTPMSHPEGLAINCTWPLLVLRGMGCPVFSGEFEKRIRSS